ncbi:hypothetical protein [Gordonia terrae]|uniref:hypothetical protein n=1 Tax=Gordonia terrae TaxID=2055 RepID=UPI00126975D2|nr:hypothetical protein [Gordonia terrae]
MALNANALKVSQRAAGANVSVDIAAGDAHLELPSTSYSFWCWTDAVTNLAFAAASTTNPRYDTVVAWVDTTVTTTTNVNSPGSLKFKVIAGTAAGSPTVISASAIQSNLGASIAWVRLADVLRPAGVDNVTNSNIFDVRQPLKLRSSSSARVLDLAGINGGSTAGTLVTDASGAVTSRIMTPQVFVAGAATITVVAPYNCTFLVRGIKGNFWATGGGQSFININDTAGLTTPAGGRHDDTMTGGNTVGRAFEAFRVFEGGVAGTSYTFTFTATVGGTAGTNRMIVETFPVL